MEILLIFQIICRCFFCFVLFYFFLYLAMELLDASPRDKEKSMQRFLNFELLVLFARFLNNNLSSSVALLTKDCYDFKKIE